MAVYSGSRYGSVEYTGIRGIDGVVRKFLHQREPLAPEGVREGFTVHVLQKQEELDGLAFNTSRKPLLWWLLADVNNVMFPLTATLDGDRGESPPELDPGAELLLPVTELQARKEP